MNDKEQEAFEIALKEFPFSKVKKIMKVLNWRWADTDGMMGFPSTQRMKKTVRSLYNNLHSNPQHITSGTGGFDVERFADGVSITFGLESSEFYELGTQK